MIDLETIKKCETIVRELETQGVKLARNGNCKFCAGYHGLWTCNKFFDLPGDSQWDFIAEKNICQICLGEFDHTNLDDCPATFHESLREMIR